MPEDTPPARDRRGIVDEVFASRHPGARRRWEIAALVVAGTFSAVFVGLPRLARPSRIDRAAAAPVQSDRRPEMIIELPPPPPVQQPPVAPAPAVGAPMLRPTPIRRRTAAPTPVQAAPIVAQVPDTQPLDFAASTFVAGKAAAYAGGASASSGTSTHAVAGGASAPAAAGSPGSRRRTVSLDQSAWSCPWPAEAEGAETTQAMVVLRVSVRSDGTAAEVKVVTDPGLGFGPAARACALRTHFRPALDDGGAAISAWSPPIRVRFLR